MCERERKRSFDRGAAYAATLLVLAYGCSADVDASKGEGIPVVPASASSTEVESTPDHQEQTTESAQATEGEDAEAQDEGDSLIELRELPASARIAFEDGNVLTFREFPNGILVTEVGSIANGPHYRPSKEPWAEVFRKLAPAVEVPEVLLRRDEWRRATVARTVGGAEKHSATVSGSPIDGAGEARGAVEDFVDGESGNGWKGGTGEFEQSASLFPADVFLAQFCAFDARSHAFGYKLTDLAQGDDQAFLETHSSHFAVAADRGDVRALFSSAIPAVVGQVSQVVNEGFFTTHDFVAESRLDGTCHTGVHVTDSFPFVGVGTECTPTLVFEHEGVVVHSVDQVASTDRYHYCGFFDRTNP